jgi:hypothetical protein
VGTRVQHLLLILVLIFVLQNLSPASTSFFSVKWTIPLGLDLLLAAFHQLFNSPASRSTPLLPRRLTRDEYVVVHHSGDLQCQLGNLGQLRKRRGPAGDRRALVSATLPDRPERFDDDDGALRVGYR